MYWAGRKIHGTHSHGQAFDLIKRQIHIGSLRPCEQFPSERKLADTLGISRATLREALKQLEENSYIVVRRGATGGTFIADDDTINKIARRFLLSQPERAWRSLEYLRACMDLASALACTRRDLKDINDLRISSERLVNAQSGGDFREPLYLFTYNIGGASKNQFFQKAAETAMESLFCPILKTSIDDLAKPLGKTAGAMTKAILDQDISTIPPLVSTFFDALTSHIHNCMLTRKSEQQTTMPPHM